MTQEEADVISEQLGNIVRQVSDLQKFLPFGTIVINGLCHAAMVLLAEAQRECGSAIRGDP